MLLLKELSICLLALTSAAHCVPTVRPHAHSNGHAHEMDIISNNTSVLPKESSLMTDEETLSAKLRGSISMEGVNRPANARNLESAMAMIDPRRHPKPKKPMGNDIGIASVLDKARDYNPEKYKSRFSSRPDHLETMVSIGIVMGGANATETDESAIVSKEIHDIMDSIPKVSDLHIADFELPVDPEEEAINRRITEVARQLAENATRKQYEDSKLRVRTPLTRNLQPYEKEITMKTVTRKADSDAEVETDISESQSDKETLPIQDKNEIAKLNFTSQKTGKSFIPSNALPLVSHLPHETAQMQLIGEIPQPQHFLLREGFPPMTPPPELVGPLLGGPVIKAGQESSMMGSAQGRSVYFRDSQQKMGLFQKNDHVFSAPTIGDVKDTKETKKFGKLTRGNTGKKNIPY